MQSAPLPTKLLSDYTTEELLQTFMLELRPDIKPNMTVLDEKKGEYLYDYEVIGWFASCWPKRLRDIPGTTPRAAVENCLKKMDVT